MPDLLVLIDRVDDLIHDARPVPLTDAVRVDPDAAGAIVAELRQGLSSVLPQASEPVALAEELERVFAKARPVPLGGESFVVEAGGTPLVEIRPARPR